MEGFKKLSAATNLDTSKKVTKKDLVEKGVNYINFGLEHANTYDLMFGTAVGDFFNYPDLLDCANDTYENMRLSFSINNFAGQGPFVSEKITIEVASSE